MVSITYYGRGFVRASLVKRIPRGPDRDRGRSGLYRVRLRVVRGFAILVPTIDQPSILFPSRAHHYHIIPEAELFFWGGTRSRLFALAHSDSIYILQPQPLNFFSRRAWKIFDIVGLGRSRVRAVPGVYVLWLGSAFAKQISNQQSLLCFYLIYPNQTLGRWRSMVLGKGKERKNVVPFSFLSPPSPFFGR